MMLELVCLCEPWKDCVKASKNKLNTQINAIKNDLLAENSVSKRMKEAGHPSGTLSFLKAKVIEMTTEAEKPTREISFHGRGLFRGFHGP